MSIGLEGKIKFSLPIKESSFPNVLWRISPFLSSFLLKPTISYCHISELFLPLWSHPIFFNGDVEKLSLMVILRYFFIEKSSFKWYNKNW